MAIGHRRLSEDPHLKPQIRKVFEIINALPTISIFKNIEEADAYLNAMQRKEIEKQKESI